MNLLQMSAAGGVLILAVTVLRALTLNKLPKGTFLALWAVAVLRLLVPFSIPSPVSVYTLAEPVVETLTDRPLTPQAARTVPAPAAPVLPNAAPVTPAAVPVSESGAAADIWFWVWLAGALACGAFFLASYLRCRREFRTALPVEDANLHSWLAGQGLHRTVSLRQSDRVRAPLTYGLLRPVILLPKAWTGGAWDRHCAAGGSAAVPAAPLRATALEHELAHVRHLDALWKPVLALTACVHWFNPLVWCMFLLANRDMELRCDEAAVRRLGLDSRSGYALALISLEEKKSGLNPFASAFSKSAIEERIIAIMKIKKRSLAAMIAAVMLVCCIGVAFATSAAEKEASDLRAYLTAIPGYTEAESRQLFSLWFEGYEDMSVADYREKMRSERGEGEFMELIERFSLDEIAYQLPAGKEADALAAFNDYFFHIYEPLTADQWLVRDFDGVGADGAEYCFHLTILDADTLTVGSYDRARSGAEEFFRRAPDVDSVAPALESLSTPALKVELEYYVTSFRDSPDADLTGAMDEIADYLRQFDGAQVTQGSDGYLYVNFDDPDYDLHVQISRKIAAEWDRKLSPYASFGLTWEFNDPDLDGNGLTMWFQGWEVRGICDEQEGTWITEHTGNSAYSDGAVELYAVYTDGVLSGLRMATPEEQAEWDQTRQDKAGATIPFGTLKLPPYDSDEEQREFPLATLEDYDALMTLRRRDTQSESLEVFNQRLLDWANENPDAWDRINCDVIWNDYDKELTSDAKTFASLTCRFSGTENGQKIRALHTGRPEEDPNFYANMPERFVEENGIRTAWCNLYYDISYHISDKSAATVQERDACVSGMMNAIENFWQDTDLDALLTMTEADVVSWLNAWAEEASTENIRFNPITVDNIQFEAYDERDMERNN